MNQPFKELKIVELASVLAAPSVGMFFAELGAEVIKVENKLTNGDVTRSWKTASEQKEKNVSAYFSSINWGKEHLFLDFKDGNDINNLKKLLEDCDIVLCNFKVGDAQKFGLEFEDIKAINPTVIYADLKGFKNDSRVAYDVVLQAETGYMYMNGHHDSAPTKMPIAFMDVLAGHQMKEGILTALYQRTKTNKAIKVEVTLEEAALSGLVNQASNWLMNKHLPTRMGSKHPNIAPYGETFKTKDDKYIVLAIGSEKQFINLLSILDLEYISYFKTNQNRLKNRDKLEDYLKPAFKKYDRNIILEKSNNLNIPIASIKNLEEVFETKTAKDLILEENIEGIVTRRVKSVIFELK